MLLRETFNIKSILSALVSFFLISGFISCRHAADEMKPERRNLTQAVYASGKILPLNHYTVYAKFPGYVMSIPVRAGDIIKTGDALLKIKNDVGEINVQNANEQLKLALQNADPDGAFLNAIRQDVSAAQSRYSLDSLNAKRTEKLFSENAISRQALDQALTQADVSRNQLTKAKENLTSAIEKVNTELKNARNLLAAQESNRNDYTILSVLTGKVYDITPSQGDYITPQNALMELGDSAEFEAELSVDESDIGLVKSGQSISYTTDAFPGKIFRGTVSEIFPHVNSSAKTSRIKATFENPDKLPLFSGASVEANIVIAEKSNALVIRKEFLSKDKTVKIKGKDNPVPVTTGAEDLEFIEVISGLSESDILEKVR